MSGMFEITTINLTEKELYDIVSNATKADGFKRAKSKCDCFTIKTSKLPVFSCYELSDAEIGLKCAFTKPDEIREAFFDLLSIKDDTISVVCYFDVNDSGEKYDPDEETDVRLELGCDCFGYVFSASIGSMCQGLTDTNYRKELFERLFKFTGCSEKLGIEFIEGELTIKIKDEKIKDQQSLSFNDFRSKTNQLLSDSVQVTCSNSKGRDVKSFSLYLFNDEDIRSLFDKLPVEYGSKLLSGELYIAVVPEKYDRICELSSVQKLSSWRASFMAKSKYTLDNLDKALAENETLLLGLFSLKNRKTGEVEVSVYKDKETLYLCFNAEMKDDNNKQEMAIHELINGLAGGRDIVDHTPI